MSTSHGGTSNLCGKAKGISELNEPFYVRSPDCASSQTTSDGFILVAVLWIVAALAALAFIFSIYLQNTAVFLSLNDSAVQTEALVLSSLELTAYQVSVPKRAGPATRPDPNVPPPPTRGEFSFRLGHANVAVNFISEASRIDVNFAQTELLTNFFGVLGAQRQEAEQYAQRIEGWTTKPRATSTLVPAEENEEALYRAAGRSYSPRGGPLAHIDELLLVLDLPPAFIARAKPFLTVYSGKPQIDVLDAAPEVLAAIPGLTPSMLSSLAEARKAGTDPQSVDRMVGVLSVQGVVSIEGGDTYRVQVRIRYDNGRREASEVVILTGIEDKPYRVLWWRDGFDALSSSVQQPALEPR